MNNSKMNRFLIMFLLVTMISTVSIVSQKNLVQAASIDQDMYSFIRTLSGVAYQKPSNNPETGFDSAGYVNYIFTMLGYEIPRSLDSQFAMKTKLITSLDQLRAGDALYFGDRLSPQFAAVYVGNKQMSMASRKAGEVVIREITSTYIQRWLGAVRILSEEDQLKAELVISAEQYLGTPYLFGAKMGQTRTFDCSSLMKTIFAEHGITLPRKSINQAKVGTYVSKKNLEVGDLVFFTTKDSGNKIGHVGMYVGQGMMIHTYGDGGVKYVSIYKDWWKDHYVTARRIF
jgi:cell wall-associated NlpC family hydrolase